MKKTRCLHASIAFVTSVGMKRFALLSICILIVSLFSCSENREARLLFERVDSLMDVAPDSVLALLDGGHLNRAKLSKEVEAKYALLYTMAQDKSGLDVDDDSLVRIAYNYYKDRASDSLYAKSQYYMGLYFMGKDSIYDAEMCLNRAIDRGKALKDYKTAYMACEQLSRSLALSDIHKSIRIAKKGLKLQEIYDSSNTSNHIYMLVNVGNKYMYTDSGKEQAQTYLLKAKNMAEYFNDTILMSYAMRNLSTAYMTLCNKDSALHYAKKAFLLNNDEQSQLLYGITLYNVDSLRISKQILTNIIEKTSSHKVLYSCYSYLNKISIKTDDIKATTENFDSANAKMSRLYMKALQLRNDYYESTIQQEKANTLLVENSKKKDIYITIAISIGLFVISIIILLYFYTKRESLRKMQLEQQRHQLELQHKEEDARRERELEECKHKLEMEAVEKRHQDELANRELQIKLMRDHLLSKLAFKKKIAKTKEENKAIKLTDDDWKDIETFLDGSDNLFVERIRKNYPDMTKKDLQFCMLLRLRCTTQDLMNIYCINEESVKHKKYLFKGKLGIQGQETSAFQYISHY
ncbi:MAG: hypothetical protein MJZ36_03210 [Bacteroidaceae bacterium]|nr:hypothetical protein [Bacteroidaceae bacterium]